VDGSVVWQRARRRHTTGTGPVRFGI
jgi:hypothetical protein